MKNRKITILGTGNVGATIAYTLTIEGLCNELVLVDIDKNKAAGEAMDIRQGLAYSHGVDIYAGEYADAKDSDIIIVTLGTGRKPGQSRIDLAQINVNIIKDVMPRVAKIAPDAIYIVVSNPVDIITYAMIKYTGLPASRVIGSGTLLDSSRLRAIIAEKINLSPKNIHAHVLGEHGDSSVVPWSLVSVFGMSLSKYCENINSEFKFQSTEEKLMIEEEMRNSGAKVIANKRATYYAIALSVKQLVNSIVRNNSNIFTVSGLLTGQYGISDVCISLPFLVGIDGLKQPLMPSITPHEEELLRHSAELLKKTMNDIEL